MKNVFKALVVTLTLVSGAANAADAKALLQFNNSSFLSGQWLQVSLLDNGDIRALRTISRSEEKVAFDGVIARLDERALEEAKAGLALVQPGMKLRDLTPAEKSRRRGCAMDSAVNYVVPGEQFEHGRLVVWQAQGCGLALGLDTTTVAGKKAEAAVSALIQIVDKAMDENRGRIYGRTAAE
jgi:hypothetical protein